MARSVVAAHVIRSPSERNSPSSFPLQRSEAPQSIRLRAAGDPGEPRAASGMIVLKKRLDNYSY